MAATAFELLAPPIQRVLWDMKWRELRPIQVDAISTVLTSEQDLLISARTASGKTEAAFLPILSRLFERPGASVGAIYIGPLKALINDQFRRLESLCERAEIPVHRWHGDIDAGKKQKLLDQPRGVLLITPESLESFFVNRSACLSRVFSELRFVVIDEIHSLVGRERGTQLRSQLFRLRRYTQENFRLLGLSATVGDAVNAYQRWMRPTQPERVSHIHDPGEKKRVSFGIYAYGDVPPRANSVHAGFRAADDNVEEEVPPELVADALRAFGGKKNLIFCNSRNVVEWLADGLNEACRQVGRPEEFLVHHGSVSKEVRLFAEEEMRGPRPATAVCSATLELGIDIGNVATVGQIGACWSVNSLVQRLGRSGRRDNEPHRMRVMIPLRRQGADAKLVDRLYPELLQAIALTELMKQRWVEPPNDSTCDLSTLVQQILSVLTERGGITAAPLYKLLVSEGAFRSISQSLFAEVLRSLGRLELVEQMSDGILLVAPKGERLVHDLEFYSAFASVQELCVRYDGRDIGTLSAMFLPTPGDHFLLAGRRWEAVQVDAQRGEVLVRPASGRRPPKFLGSGGEIHTRVRETMRQIVAGAETYDYLNQTAQGCLTEGRAAYRNSRLHDTAIIDDGGGGCRWFTWTGTVVQRTLVLIAQHAGLDCVDERFAILFGANPAEVAAVLGRASRQLTENEMAAAELPVGGWRKFDDCLTEELLRKAFIAERLDIAGARQAIEELCGYFADFDLAAALRTWESQNQQVKERTSGADDWGSEYDDVETWTIPANVSNLALSDCEFAAFDLETSGLNPLSAKIVEIAGLRFLLDGRENHCFATLVDPGTQIPMEATRIHGITSEMVLGGPKCNTVLPQFLEQIAKPSTFLLAHNAPFDREFLSLAASAARISLPPHPVLDTLTLSRRLLPGLVNHRLATVANHFGIAVGSTHRAFADTQLVKSVFLALVKLAHLETTEQLFALSGVKLLDAPFLAECVLPPGFEEFGSAIESGSRIQMVYAASMREASLREITPLRVTSTNGKYYVSAVCHVDEVVKTFRLDRIRKFVVRVI